MKARHSLLASAAAAAALISAIPAQAQTPSDPVPDEPSAGTPEGPAAEEGGLAEIVVTAQKRAQNLQDVPIAVTALTAQDLTSANIEGQLTLPKITPNVNFTVIASFAAVYVRGVGTQFANPGLESSVSVYFDDTYIPRAASAMFSFTDVERIEVLKGPQGTLYGRNATGGAIRIITHDPKPEFDARTAVTIGTDDRFVAEGMINIPIAEGISARFAARHDENDGYMRNLYPGTRQKRAADRNEEMYSGKLLIEPAEDLTIKISGDYMRKNDSEGHDFKNLFPGPPEQIGAALGGCVAQGWYTLCNDDGTSTNTIKFGQNIEAWGVTGRIDYDVGPAILSSITAFRKHDEYNSADLDSTGLLLQHGTGLPKTSQFTQELQVASDSGARSTMWPAFIICARRPAFISASGAPRSTGHSASPMPP